MRTTYEGPTRTIDLQFAGHGLKVVVPADPDRLLNDPDVLRLNQQHDYMPYWAYLWPGAYLLAEVVARETWSTEAAEALEIGCGLGVAGLMALKRGLRVHFTDYDETPLHFLSRSAEANQLPQSHLRVSKLDWSDLPQARYPIILGADVLYERRLVPLVCNLVAHLLEPGGLALLAGPYRAATEDLASELPRHGLQASCHLLEAADEFGSPVRGQLHRLSHLRT